MPFGAGTTPQGDPTALSGMISGAMDLPRQAIEGSAHDVQHLGTGEPMQSVGPAWEATRMLAGGILPQAEANAAGIFGGKLAKTANLDKLAQAQRMMAKGQGVNITRQLTGWHQGPEGQWRFEIPDERSRMMYPNGTGPAGTMFQHNELYKAYPELQNIKMSSEVNPNYPSDTGGWNLGTGLMQMSSRSPAQARLGGLHEMQHAVQHIEGFAPGTTEQAYQEALKNAPQRIKEAAGTADPFELYRRTVGEVESRNVEARSNYNPTERYNEAPWQTQDTPYNKQLVIPSVPEHPDVPLLKVLRGQK